MSDTDNTTSEPQRDATAEDIHSPWLDLPALQRHLCGASRSTIERLVEAGTLPPPTAIGRKLFWWRQDIALFDAQQLNNEARLKWLAAKRGADEALM